MINKILVLAVVFSLLICSATLMAKERRGAAIVIQKLDGLQVEGELIAVRQNSLLLLGSEGSDISVDIEKAKVIKVRKKSRFVYGFLIGASCGALAGLFLAEPHAGEKDAPEGLLTLIFAGVGALPGSLGGIMMGIDDSYQIEGKSADETKTILEKLRRQARVTDAQ